MGSPITRNIKKSFDFYDSKFIQVTEILGEKKVDDKTLILQLTNTLECIKKETVLSRIERILSKNFQIKNVLVNTENIQRKSEFVCEIIYPLATGSFVDVIKIKYDHLGNLPQVLVEIFQDLLICVTQKHVKNVLLTSIIYVPSSTVAKYDFKKFHVITQYGLEKSFENIFGILTRIQKDDKMISILNGNITTEIKELANAFKINPDTNKPEAITIFHLMMKLFVLQQFLFEANFTWETCIKNIKEKERIILKIWMIMENCLTRCQISMISPTF
jgi:hypothetical protein